MVATSSKDVHERLTEDSSHQSIWKLSPMDYAAKEKLPRKNMWLEQKLKGSLPPNSTENESLEQSPRARIIN